MLEIKGKRWRKLDNAAKIFPATSGRKDTRVFRFFCELKESIDGDVLQEALDRTMEKYPMFRSVMRKGLFWYYLEKSDLPAVVSPEKEPPCMNLYIRDQKKLLFQVNYYRNRINFEVYHALTDGTGAVQFLKELVKNYLLISHKDKNLPDLPFTKEDVTLQDWENDSFSKYYRKTVKDKTELQKREKPCRITGPKAGYGNLNVTEGLVSSRELKKKAKEFGVSVTVFLSSILLCAIHEEMSGRQSQKDVILMVPVNLRNYFPSESMLNFFGWIEPGYGFDGGDYSFEEVVKTVDAYFKKELTPERLEKHMNKYMDFEQNPLIRMVPLELKNPVLQLANKVAGKDLTAILSNVGIITLPPEYAEYVQRFGVFISTAKLQLSMCSFEDDVMLSFASAFESKNIERNFFRMLKNFGVSAEILKDQFPEEQEGHYGGRKFFQWFTFSCILIGVLAFMINTIFTPSRDWFLLAIGITLSMWVTTSIGFFKRHNLQKNGLWQLIVFSVGCILWDRFTGWRGWSLDYAFPAICLAVTAAFMVITRIQKLKVEEYMIYYIIAGIFGMIPLLLFVIGLVHVQYLSVISGGLNFLLLAGLFIFKGKDMRAELHKKLHF
ncbi:MAG: hypothetical protein EOM34_12045 [Clostridia bacterium]|nr:hypothetical protein [Clostridia bacterium]NCD03208.1 hypothetical protein [Clostridia bacterium]